MGIEPYLVASSLEAVLAQRLIRVLCPECKEEDRSSKTQAFKEKMELPSDHPIFHAVGCHSCRQTGYRGRRGVFELMELDEEIRQLILRACSAGEIREIARRHGMRTLNEDGLRLIEEGITTLDEVLRVTKSDHSNEWMPANA